MMSKQALISLRMQKFRWAMALFLARECGGQVLESWVSTGGGKKTEELGGLCVVVPPMRQDDTLVGSAAFQRALLALANAGYKMSESTAVGFPQLRRRDDISAALLENNNFIVGGQRN